MLSVRPRAQLNLGPSATASDCHHGVEFKVEQSVQPEVPKMTLHIASSLATR